MDLLKSGQKLSIFFPKSNKMVEICCVISKVFNDRMIIDLPQYFMRYIEFLEVGKRLTVKVFSKLGTIDFNTVVIASPLEDDFLVELDYNAMKLTPGEEIPVIQAIEELYIKNDFYSTTVKTFEISTEYLKFYSDRKCTVNETFDCELILPKDYGTIKFKATVTNVDPVYDNEITVSYFCMSETDRQSLLYYMYLYSNNSN